LKIFVSFADSLALKNRPDADLLLIKPCKSGFDVQVIKFASRLALEKFNVRAGLSAVVKTQVPLNCAVHRHQSDSDARAKLSPNSPQTLTP
jgi:hypothetical protein